MRKQFFYNFTIFFSSILIYSCDTNNLHYEPKDFFDDFFKMNSEIIFTDELARVQINYFSNSNLLVYTFKNMSKIENQGELFLQIYPKDTSNLSPVRKPYEFTNLSIYKNEILKLSDTRNFLIKTLQFPYKVKKISTGYVYNGKKKWKINYSDPNILEFKDNAKLIDNDINILFNKIKTTNSRLTLGNLGVKIFSNKEKKIEAYYNANNQNLITYFGDLDTVIKQGEYFIKINLENNQTISKTINLANIKNYNNLGLIQKKLNYNIKTISIGQKDWNKKITISQLINYTHLKSIKNKKFNDTPDYERLTTLTDYFLTNTLKTLFFKKNKLEIFVNGSRRSFYIKSNLILNNLTARIYSTDEEYTNNKTYKDVTFKTQKRMILNQKEVVYHIRVPAAITKIEFGTLQDTTFNIHYTFDKQ